MKTNFEEFRALFVIFIVVSMKISPGIQKAFNCVRCELNEILRVICSWDGAEIPGIHKQRN